MLTVKAQLLPTADQECRLLEAMAAFNEACNYMADFARKQRTFDHRTIRKSTYAYCRKAYRLPSQMALRAVFKAVEGLRAKSFSPFGFKANSVMFFDDKNFRFKDVTVASISLLDGREDIPVYLMGYFIAPETHKRGKNQVDLYHDEHENWFVIASITGQPFGADFHAGILPPVDLGIAPPSGLSHP